MKTTKKKGQKIQLSKCNPHRTKNNDNNFSCFNKKALIKIINSWNKKFDDKARVNDESTDNNDKSNEVSESEKEGTINSNEDTISSDEDESEL